MIVTAAEQFGNRLKKKIYFDNCNFRFTLCKIPFTGKSKWVPPDGKLNPNILACINDYMKEIREINVTSDQKNLTKNEHLALKNLKQNNNIIIKKADKGSAVVIMDKESYLHEGYRQLSNPLHYKKLDSPIYHQTATKISEILQNLKDNKHITDKQFEFLKPPSTPRPRRFYMLPKIHKPTNTWTLPHKIPVGRPIVSDCSSESENIAAYIDHFIQNEAKRHPAYIKNTEDFINKIHSLELPKDFLLVTMDIESMYTNINHDKGLEATREALGRVSYTNDKYKAIVELLEISLKCNDFEFNGDFYLQTLGTSMGKKWAPHYADIYMAKFEKDALQKCPLKPHTYLRYLDDIFIIWTHGKQAFFDFLNIFNSHQPPIKFKAEIQNYFINFLDTTIFKGGSDSDIPLLTKVYFKPTDTHQLLHKTSFHPKHTYKGLIKSQLFRFIRICTRTSDFNEAWNVLYEALSSRNYSKRWLRKMRIECMHEIEQKIAWDYMPVTNPSSSSAGASPCNVAKCKTCPLIHKCHNFDSTELDTTHSIIDTLNCNSSHIIYLYTCNICKIQYVGETGNTLRNRTNRHRTAIKTGNEDNALAAHLNNKHPDIEPSIASFTLTPIEQVGDMGNEKANLLQRRMREQQWITTLHTFEPKGLNVKIFNYKTPLNDDKDILPFIIPYSGTSAKAAKIVKKHMQTLLENEDIVGNSTFRTITAYSRHKNLSNLLVNSLVKE